MADPQRTINVVTTSPLPSSSSDSSNSDDSSSDTKSTFTKRDKLALRKLKRKAEKLELAINSSIAKRPAVTTQQSTESQTELSVAPQHDLRYTIQPPPTNPTRSSTICTYCRKIGHSIDVCRKRQYINEKRNSTHLF